MNAFHRIKALIVKELLAMLRDKKARITLILPPLMQLILFANAATLEVRNISVVYLNQDQGWYSHELIERIKGSPYFKKVYQANDEAELQAAINTQQAIVALSIQSDFSSSISQGKAAQAQIILDGRKTNASQIVQGYLSRIMQNFNVDILRTKGKFSAPTPTIDFRSWFNPNLDYLFFTVPHLVGILSMIIGLIVTALSVAREREMGTFDQLLVSPLQTWEIVTGKMLPAMIIGIAESTLLMVLAFGMYQIPFHGSFLLLYISLVIFVTAIIGIGLFISALSQTQQQATLGVFAFMMPTMLLSGFATPIENMPQWLQPLSWLIPISHLFTIIKGVFLKNMNAIEVFRHLLPIASIALITLPLSAWIFKRRLE